MPGERHQPFAVSFSNAVVRVAALVVPAGQRAEWISEWHAEIWHRWQFLFHTGEWNRREKRRLIRSSLGAFLDAAWILASQEALRNRIREVARSPLSCLYFLSTLLLLIAVFSAGLPATRQLMFAQSDQTAGRLLFIWLHPEVGGGDKGMPAEIVTAWATRSKFIREVAAFDARHQPVAIAGSNAKPLVVTTEPALFNVLDVKPSAGRIPPAGGIVLDHRAWVSLTHADPHALGGRMKIGADLYPVSAILPEDFRFLSRQPTVYLVERLPAEARVYSIARLRTPVKERVLDHELTKIAEDACYYFLQGQLRFSFWRGAILTPLFSFAVSLALSAALALMVYRLRIKQVRKATARGLAFFAAKLSLALACVFVACLEWSRSENSVLLASRDPGNGPFLIWLYVLGTMGVLFWAIADQGARCRVCLRLLAFPVRIGCPGCLLLDWSGTELFCSEGHGVLHVPHMAPSWDEESERWIALDESWQGLFEHEKQP